MIRGAESDNIAALSMGECQMNRGFSSLGARHLEVSPR